MTGLEIGIASMVAIVVLIYAGMHVSIALCVVSLVGVWGIKGNFALAEKLLALAASDAVSSYEFGVVPLFVLMGLMVSVAGIGRDTFVAANVLLRGMRGGLGVATVVANAAFAAVTGISIASAAVFTKIAVPEMLKLGYQPRFAVGVVAGSSVLGMLIPPSLLLIIFGLLAEVSIGDLFIAGIVPGLLLAGAFCLMIILMAYFTPERVQNTAGAFDQAKSRDDLSIPQAMLSLLPMIGLVFLVMGGIYAGWFTPTESGAIGALGAFVLALARRRLTLATTWKVLIETGYVTVSILFLIIAANIYSRLLALSGMPQALDAWVAASQFGFYHLLIIYVLIVVAMGTLIDGVSIMLIMVPMFLPPLQSFDVNLIWFGIITVIAVEIGLLTPPFGLSVYVIKSTLHDDAITLNDIFAGAAPYAITMFLVLLLIIFIPGIALVLL
jgi:tripartite ATP-independent transporter DctM subunit